MLQTFDFDVSLDFDVHRSGNCLSGRVNLLRIVVKEYNAVRCHFSMKFEEFHSKINYQHLIFCLVVIKSEWERVVRCDFLIFENKTITWRREFRLVLNGYLNESFSSSISVFEAQSRPRTGLMKFGKLRFWIQTVFRRDSKSVFYLKNSYKYCYAS